MDPLKMGYWATVATWRFSVEEAPPPCVGIKGSKVTKTQRFFCSCSMTKVHAYVVGVITAVFFMTKWYLVYILDHSVHVYHMCILLLLLHSYMVTLAVQLPPEMVRFQQVKTWVT